MWYFTAILVMVVLRIIRIRVHWTKHILRQRTLTSLFSHLLLQYGDVSICPLNRNPEVAMPSTSPKEKENRKRKRRQVQRQKGKGQRQGTRPKTFPWRRGNGFSLMLLQHSFQYLACVHSSPTPNYWLLATRMATQLYYFPHYAIGFHRY